MIFQAKIVTWGGRSRRGSVYQRVLGLQDLRWEMCVLSAEKACISDGEKEAQIKNFFHETNHVMFCLPCDYV